MYDCAMCGKTTDPDELDTFNGICSKCDTASSEGAKDVKYPEVRKTIALLEDILDEKIDASPYVRGCAHRIFQDLLIINLSLNK